MTDEELQAIRELTMRTRDRKLGASGGDFYDQMMRLQDACLRLLAWVDTLRRAVDETHKTAVGFMEDHDRIRERAERTPGFVRDDSFSIDSATGIWRGNCPCGKWIVLAKSWTREKPYVCEGPCHAGKLCGRRWFWVDGGATFEEGP